MSADDTAPSGEGARDPFAPKNAEGLSPYVVATYSWGRTSEHVVYAETLAKAKAKHGWTRQAHTSIRVRRARMSDVTR